MPYWIEEEGEIPEEYLGKEIKEMEQVYEEPQWQTRSGAIPANYLGTEEQREIELEQKRNPRGGSYSVQYHGTQEISQAQLKQYQDLYGSQYVKNLGTSVRRGKARTLRAQPGNVFVQLPKVAKDVTSYRSYYQDPQTGKVTYGNWTTDKNKLGMSGTWKESVLVPVRTENWNEYRSYYEDPETGGKIYGDWTKNEEATGGLTGTWRRQSVTPNAETVQKLEFYNQQLQKAQQMCSSYRGAQFNVCMKAVSEKIQAQMQKSIPGFASGGMVSTKEPTMMNRNMYPQGYAEGGMPMPMEEEAMPGLMEPPMPMPEEDTMEQEQATMLEGILEPEEMDLLATVVEQFPELIPVLDKIDMAVGSAGEFEGEGPVSGPGTETSDSIPAKLSDGEFVFTAKAVKQLGVDKLRKMMDKAEAEYDASMVKQEEMQGMGFAFGGLVKELADQRKMAADYVAPVAEYDQPALMQKPVRLDGAGRQVPQGQTGILAQREVDMRQQERTMKPRMEQNMNQQSMGQASTAAAAGTPRASMETEMGRADMRQRLDTAADEEAQRSLMLG